MASKGIQGQPLDVTVVGCSRLRDTEWISRQDPYVRLEYANHKFRTKTCTDGGKHPTFNEKFVLPLIEGLREITVTVWNSNTLQYDDFIGSGKIYLERVLSAGYDDSTWPLQSKTGKNAGEVKIILHYENKNKTKPDGSAMNNASSCCHGSSAPSHYQQPYSGYPPASYASPPPSSYAAPYPPSSAYPNAYPPPPSAYPQPPGAYPPNPAYPNAYGGAPPPAYGGIPPSYGAPPPAYPPAGYPPAYPPAGYPPPGGYPYSRDYNPDYH